MLKLPSQKEYSGTKISSGIFPALCLYWKKTTVASIEEYKCGSKAMVDGRMNKHATLSVNHPW